MNELQFTLTPLLKESVGRVLANTEIVKTLQSEQLEALLDYNDDSTAPPTFVHEILKGASVYVPPKIVVKDENEAEKIAKRIYLTNQLEQRRYDAMTRNIDSSKHKVDPMAMKDLKSQMSMAVNMLVTFITLLVGGVFVGGRMTGNYLVGVAIGLGLGAIGVAIEVWLFFLRSTGTQMNQDKEARKEQRYKDVTIRRQIRIIKKQQESALIQDGPVDTEQTSQ
eukprot:gene7692-9004_t